MTNWATISLGDVADFRNGLNYTDADLGKGLAVIGVADFQDKVTVELGGLSQLSVSALSKADALVQLGDIVFVRSNGNRELIGRSLFLKDKPQIPTSHSGFTIRCRFHNSRCRPRFYAYLFRGPIIRQILSAQGGGTNISNLNQGILTSLKVPLPGLDVQDHIASILSAYDNLIENNTRRIAILEEMARRIFEEWFVHFRAPGCDGLPMVESAIGPVPQGWEISTLDSLCSRITDGAHHSPPSVEQGPTMLSVKDMRNWGFDFSECRSISQPDFDDLVRNNCRPLADDILIAKDGANLNKHTFLIEEDLDAVILSSIAILRPGPSVEKEFLVATLKSDDVSRRIKNSRSGAAIPRIILKDFRRLPVILPPRELRARFEKTVRPVHKLPLAFAIKRQPPRPTRPAAAQAHFRRNRRERRASSTGGRRMTLELGRLEPVSVRDVWPHEANDFTPWLALSDNLSLLAETLDLGELSEVRTEVPVVNFYIDILAKDGLGGVV